jgi:hypothetical protein
MTHVPYVQLKSMPRYLQAPSEVRKTQNINLLVMEYTYSPNTFFPILLLLVLTFIYCRYYRHLYNTAKT